MPKIIINLSNNDKLIKKVKEEMFDERKPTIIDYNTTRKLISELKTAGVGINAIVQCLNRDNLPNEQGQSAHDGVSSFFWTIPAVKRELKLFHRSRSLVGV